MTRVTRRAGAAQFRVSCRLSTVGGCRDDSRSAPCDDRPDAAEARQLHGRVAQVEAGDEAEDIELDPLDPAELDAEQAPQARLDAGAAVGQARIGQRAEVAADRVRRQRSTPSSGTARSTVATNVLLFGPGQIR